MFAVQPVPFCPHLVDVQPLPSDQLDAKQPCGKCGDASENWICLVCYQVTMTTVVSNNSLVSITLSLSLSLSLTHTHTHTINVMIVAMDTGILWSICKGAHGRTRTRERTHHGALFS